MFDREQYEITTTHDERPPLNSNDAMFQNQITEPVLKDGGHLIIYGDNMNEKSDVPCNCVREPCDCSAKPFPSAEPPPPIVSVRYIYRRLADEQLPAGTQQQAPTTANSSINKIQSTQTAQILGLPWYYVVGGAILAFWAINSNGGK